jgi:hypothetical protein
MFEKIFYNIYNLFVCKQLKLYYPKSKNNIKKLKDLTFNKNSIKINLNILNDILLYLLNINVIILNKYHIKKEISSLSLVEDTNLINSFKKLNNIKVYYDEALNNLSDVLYIKKYKKHNNSLTFKQLNNKILIYNNIKSLQRYNEIYYNIINEINIINNKLLNSNISNYNYNDIRYIRIFNNYSFIQGGRIYNKLQLLDKQSRNNILINNLPIISLDFKNSHINILYNLLNINSNDEDLYNFNLYNLPDKISRKINKLIILILLNTKNINIMLNKLQKLIINIFIEENVNIYNYFNIVNKDFNNYLKPLINGIIDKHHIIKKFFNSKISLLLQFIESEIIINTMLDLLNDNIISLSIHDELIVPYKYKDVAIEYINKNYNYYIHKTVQKKYYNKFLNQLIKLNKINKSSLIIDDLKIDKNMIFKPIIKSSNI